MRIAVAALLLASAAPACAQTGRSGPPPASIVAEPAALLLAGCDADGDARVTRAEQAACIARSFVGDPAQSGSLGYIGYADWALKWLGDRNALPSPFTLDADGDNRITPAEVQANFAATFARLDVDRDGALTRAELLTIRGGTGGEDGRGRKGRR